MEREKATIKEMINVINAGVSQIEVNTLVSFLIFAWLSDTNSGFSDYVKKFIDNRSLNGKKLPKQEAYTLSIITDYLNFCEGNENSDKKIIPDWLKVIHGGKSDNQQIPNE